MLEIKNSIENHLRKYQDQSCKFIILCQPFNGDSRKRPMFGFTWYAYRQYLITKHIFRKLSNFVSIVDSLSLTSSLVGLGIHSRTNIYIGRLPKVSRTLMAKKILEIQSKI